MKENLILIGFMGTGKTSLGKLLANKLGRGFVDLDQKIEHDSGMTIPKIFELYGEKYFRELEKKAVREVCERKNLVIATGGGTVKDSENVRLLKSSGKIVCLTCEPEEIFRRTERRGEDCKPSKNFWRSEKNFTAKPIIKLIQPNGRRCKF